MARGRTALAAALLAVFAAPAGAASTGTLVVCDDVQEPTSLDPFQIFSEKTLTILQQTLEGLVRLDAEGKVVPALAERWERVDDKRMRFFLRRGVRFHDGSSFDASAVKFSVERYVAPGTHYPGFGFVETISSVEIVDDHTVDVATNRPDGLLLNRLATWALIVPPGYYARVGDAGFSKRPVGTGPFRFESWDKGRRVSFSANESYWLPSFPKVDGLDFVFVPAEKQLELLESGGIDLATELPGTLTTRAVGTGSIKVLKKPSFYAVTGSFNAGHGPLKSLQVRQALNYAIDRAELLRYDQFGNGREIATVTMPGEEGHDESLRPYPYDPVKARKLLKEAGYPDGFALKAIAKLQGIRAPQILVKQLAKIGVTLTLQPVSDAEIMDVLKREPWDMIIAGCPDPMATAFFIQSIFLFSKSPYALSADAEYDRRLNEMVATLDDAKRSEAGRRLDRYIHDQASMLFLYQRIKTHGLRRGVSFTPSITGMPYFFDARKASP